MEASKISKGVGEKKNIMSYEAKEPLWVEFRIIYGDKYSMRPDWLNDFLDRGGEVKKRYFVYLFA